MRTATVPSSSSSVERDGARTVVVVRAAFVATFAIAIGGAIGCGQQQSAACKTFIACEQAYAKASNTAPTDVTQYEADGVCWQSADNAEKCDQQCTDGTAAVRQAASDANLTVPACK